MKMPKYISLKKFMQMYGIGQTKAYELMHRKGFPARKIEGRWKIELAKLEEWEATFDE
ncbi:MAG: DNA-binding protein [Clostridiales bacterium]|nr:DNA-binding protein [Clostridiales bacterium]MBD8948045.1 DNA-binding protein [Clostridiales bacterium]DAI53552.1 MAG TPA: helix-turn-helix domain protein [Caudoviricetes sp.]